jgi:endonuclease/exonuclease/phosphatase family metal-dependent hydrolase
VIALQEANDPAAVAALAASLGMQLVYGDANSAYAVAWLSRLPVTRFENHRLAVLDKTLLEIEVEGLRLFTTHLSAGRTLADEPHRIAETEALLAEIGGLADVLTGDFNAVHPADDIGTPPPEERLDHVSRRPIELVLEAGFADCYRTHNPDAAGWTYLAWHLWARIDYVFAKHATRSCRVIETDASDHFAVFAEI